MLPKRSVRAVAAMVLLGLVGSVPGCSGGSSPTPVPTKEEAKKISEEMKSAQQERMKAMRLQKNQGRR